MQIQIVTWPSTRYTRSGRFQIVAKWSTIWKQSGNNMNINKKTKGESLLEGIIAFTILGLGIAFSGVIMGTSIRNMDNSKNRVIAINAAREGIEAMRNIRDTNWLAYSTKRRSCWNHMPQKNPSTGCTTSLISPGRYIIYKDGTYRWRLTPISADGAHSSAALPSTTDLQIYYDNNNLYRADNSKWVDARTLYSVDIEPNKDSDNDGTQDNDQDFLNNIFIKDGDAWGKKVRKTALKREINIGYLKNDGSTGNTTNNRMLITSKVTWIKGDKEFKVELKTHLTDYLGREKI